MKKTWSEELFEQGFAKGFAKGFAESFSESFAKSYKETAIESAKRIIADRPDITDEKLGYYTGLSVLEIKKLKANH